MRSQTVTAELDAGWIYSMRNPAQSVDQLHRMQQAWRDAGCAPEARYLPVHRWHLMKLRPEEEPLVTSGLIQNLTFSGTKEALRKGIRALRDASFSQFAAHIRYGQDAMLEEWAEVLSGV